MQPQQLRLYSAAYSSAPTCPGREHYNVRIVGVLNSYVEHNGGLYSVKIDLVGVIQHRSEQRGSTTMYTIASLCEEKKIRRES